MISIEDINNVKDREFKRIEPTKTQELGLWGVLFDGRLWKTYKGKFTWTKKNHAMVAMNNALEIGITASRMSQKYREHISAKEVAEDAKEIRKHLESIGVIQYVKLEVPGVKS